MDEDETGDSREFLQFSLRGRGIFSGGPNTPDKKSCKEEGFLGNNDIKLNFEKEYCLNKVIEEYDLEQLAYFQKWDSMFLSWVEILHSNNNVSELIKYIIQILDKLTKKLEQNHSCNTEGFGDIIIEKMLSNMLCKHLISSRSNDLENSGRFIVNTNLIYELILHLSDSCVTTYSETIRCIQKIIHFSQLEVSNSDDTSWKNYSSVTERPREYLIDGLIMQLCKLVQHQNSIIRTEVVGILIYAILAVPMSSKFPYNPTRIVQALVWSIYDDEEEVVCRSIDGLRVYLSVVGTEYFNTVINLAVDAIPKERKQNSPFNPLKMLHQRILENAQLPDIEDGAITFADFNFSSSLFGIDKNLNNEILINNDQTSENIQTGVNKISKFKSLNNREVAGFREKNKEKERIQNNFKGSSQSNSNQNDREIIDFPENYSINDERLETITRTAVDFLLNSELLIEDWGRVVEEITNLRRIIIYHSLFLNKSNLGKTYTKNIINTTVVGESIIRWVCSLRSCVCKSALQGIEDLYTHCGSSLDLGKLLDISLEKILKRTTDRNKFIANDATKTLITICSIKAGDKLLGKLVNQGLKNRSTIIIYNALKATAVVLEKIGTNIIKCSHLLQCLEFIHNNINGPTPDIRTYSKVCIGIVLSKVDWKCINQTLRRSVAPFKLENMHRDFESIIKVRNSRK